MDLLSLSVHMFYELRSHGGPLNWREFASTTTVMEITMPSRCNEDCQMGNIHELTH